MTVQTTTSRADYTGNGVTTAFTVPFYFLDNSHLTVLRTVIATGVSTTLAITTDYTVSGAGVSAGGTITCVTAPTSAQKISILRNVPLTQLSHYVPNDPFPAATHEQIVDQLTMEVQQINEVVSRAITLPAATSGVSTSLPTAQPNQLLAFNQTGTAITTIDPTSVLTVVGSSGFSTQAFSGNSSTTVFTLSASPGAIANLEVFISGVRQRPTTDYTLSGTALTFVAAPGTGTNNILARWGTTLGIGIPSDTSVTAAKMATGAAVSNIGAGGITSNELAGNSVTTAKITDANVTSTKLATGAAVANIGVGGITSNELASNAVTAAKITDANVTPAKLSQPFTAGTAVASTSGTAIDFTGIPSWVKRVTVVFNGVSTSGTSVVQIQLGSGSVQTTGYSVVAVGYSANTTATAAYTSGFGTEESAAANFARYGHFVFTNLSGSNVWVGTGLQQRASNVGANTAGGVTLAGTLDRVRITTVNGTDTFDAGSINILYE